MLFYTLCHVYHGYRSFNSHYFRALISNDPSILPCFTTVYLTIETRWPTKTVRGWNWTAGGCRSVSRAFGTSENFAFNYDYLPVQSYTYIKTQSNHMVICEGLKIQDRA
ncbi:hypothetical protein K435DRAFT_269866 [Dendrothele bispora CBS 962.96]|uniref:Uncharacterized protein n=1 Tax=Dendrothele bispora (strain CBS 962.96) TaxID=1314807 RepID=A0A4S8MLJ3_DENBC|nr:hypothetical protein K435DRAFT_269866 [Dendrothele bispora CBS 962.96]